MKQPDETKKTGTPEAEGLSGETLEAVSGGHGGNSFGHWDKLMKDLAEAARTVPDPIPTPQNTHDETT